MEIPLQQINCTYVTPKRMKFRFLFLIFIGLFLTGSNRLFGQMVGTDVFLAGPLA